VVRFNALQHGLLARDVVLPGEDADAFEDLWNQVRADLAPVGPIEELLADRVINAVWRLRRLTRAETALFHWRVHGLKADRLAKQVRSYEETLLDRLSFPTEITDKAAHTEAKEARARATRAGPGQTILGRALDADAKGRRFEARPLRKGLERSLLNPRRAPPATGPTPDRPSPPILDAVPLAAGIQNDELSADLRIPSAVKAHTLQRLLLLFQLCAAKFLLPTKPFNPAANTNSATVMLHLIRYSMLGYGGDIRAAFDEIVRRARCMLSSCPLGGVELWISERPHYAMSLVAASHLSTAVVIAAYTTLGGHDLRVTRPLGWCRSRG
jgi:hypothetical protein